MPSNGQKMNSTTRRVSLITLLVGVVGLAALAAVALHGRGVTAPEHRQLVAITPNKPSKTVSFDYSLKRGSPDIAADDPRVMKEGPGCAVPEQVHLTYWSSTSVLVSWATCDAQLATGTVPEVRAADGSSSGSSSGSSINSVVLYGTISGMYDKAAVGIVTSYSLDYTELEGDNENVDLPSYRSPTLHHVLLRDLQPGYTYFYSPSVLSPLGGLAPVKEYNFTVPRPQFPLRLGVLADPGQTYNTSVVLRNLRATNPDLVMCVGDFAYADEWLSMDQRVPKDLDGKYTYQPKWDTFGRLFEPLLAHVPLIHTDGNHELERTPDAVTHTAYNHRYPVPQNSTEAPQNFTGTSKSESSYSNLYYAVELPGMFKAISLTSYSPEQLRSSGGFHDKEEQYVWLERELAKTNRTATPWLILLVHAPWYSSYASHFKQNECMREQYEPLVVKYGVDIMLFGHVHAYERNKPIRNYEVDDCGPVHITIGNGGNIGGMYDNFIDATDPLPSFCNDPHNGKQFPGYSPHQCLTWQNGDYCFRKQPEWSAMREPSFGHGTLDLMNATHAVWYWTKNQGPEFNVADQVTIIRNPEKHAAQCAT